MRSNATEFFVQVKSKKDKEDSADLTQQCIESDDSLNTVVNHFQVIQAYIYICVCVCV